MEPIYITTSIAYPNASPHIGFAMELLQADFFARYYRRRGDDVYFQTGVDVHGLKVQRAAERVGQTARQFVDEKSVEFQALLSGLGVEPSRFIRTLDEDHQEMAQALWRACAAKGDIYKKRYQAWYNLREEEFLGLVEDFPDPKVFGVEEQFIEKIDEENYFFALSRYQEEIKQRLESEAYRLLPVFRRKEMLTFLREKGLQDVSISRERSKLSWGVPVPDDPEQVMYVWFDALTNYLTPACRVRSTGKGGGDEAEDGGLIQPGKYWPARLHCVGKDIARFHALLWPGMLLSAGLPLPKELLVHGFITVGGEKMSKSIGNVVAPLPLVERHGQDAVRWFFLKEMRTYEDGDFTEERLQQVFLADLANDYGNLVSRVLAMLGKYHAGLVPVWRESLSDGLVPARLTEGWAAYHAAVERREIDAALRAAQELIVLANHRVEEGKPWLLAKEPERQKELDTLLYELLEVIRQVTAMVSPVLLSGASKVERALGVPKDQSLEAAARWGELAAGEKFQEGTLILYPKA